MLLLDSNFIPDWKMLLFGSEDHHFLIEIFFRAIVMFLVVLISLRLLGKRGVKQLSIFELVIILTLGSAAGDPMFYKDVGLLPAIMVFVMIVSLYRFVIHLAEKNDWLNRMIEGKPVCLVEDGKLCIDNFTKEPIAYDEMFSQMRMLQVSQLGQIRKAYIETSGEISVFFYPDDKVKDGLPLFPELLDSSTSNIAAEGSYSCILCGYTARLVTIGKVKCPDCGKDSWVPSSNEKRIS